MVESASKQAVVIDPWDGEEVEQWAKTKQFTLSGILNTHSHHDHIRGNAFLQSLGVPVLDKFESTFPGFGEKETWPTPGHTMEHKVFWLKDGEDEHLFVGDTLFQAGVGNCKNGGEPKVLFQTIENLKKKLSPNIFLHPGHDYLERNLAFATHVDPKNQEVAAMLKNIKLEVTYELPPLSWKTELKINPFLRTQEFSIREQLVSKLGVLANLEASDQIVFIALRQLRDNW